MNRAFGAVGLLVAVGVTALVAFALGYWLGYDSGYLSGYACGSVDWIHMLVYETEIGRYMDGDRIYQKAVDGYGVTAEECVDPYE